MAPEPGGRAGSGEPAAPAAGAALGNRYGRTSVLRLAAEARAGRTVLAERMSTMPLRVMRPLPIGRSEFVGLAQDAADPAQVMVMSASAGLMAGDRQSFEVTVGPGAALQMTTQAFEKVHRMPEGSCARRAATMRVEDGGYLDYRPQPLLPFADSDLESTCDIELAGPSARLAYEEVLCCGRVARGERFGYRRFRNHVRIDVAGVPAYVDNALYVPRGLPAQGLAPMPMEALGLYEGLSHVGNLVLVNVGVDEERFCEARDYLRGQTGVIGAAAGTEPVGASRGSEAVAGGITRLGTGDVAVRLLGHRAQRVTDVLACVRGILGGRSVSAPH